MQLLAYVNLYYQKLHRAQSRQSDVEMTLSILTNFHFFNICESHEEQRLKYILENKLLQRLIQRFIIELSTTTFFD